MSSKQRRSEANLEYLYARLDAVRMSCYERQHAKASLARADAIAGVLVDSARGIRRLLKNLVILPIRRLTASVG